MIVNLLRRDGDSVTTVPLDSVIFEGGEPHLGVIATFVVDGREATAMVIEVSPSSFADPPDPAVTTTVTVEEPVRDEGGREPPATAATDPTGNAASP